MNCNCLPIHLINIPFNQISEVNDIWNKQIRWGPHSNQYSTQSRDWPLWRGWWRPLSPASSHGGGAWQLSVVSYWVSTQSRHLRTLTLWLPSVSCPAQPPVTSVWRHMTTGLSIWCRDSVKALYVSFLCHKYTEKKEKCLLWGFRWLEQCIYGIRDQHSSLSLCLDLGLISTWRLGSLSHDEISLIVMMTKCWVLIYLSEKTHQERMDNLRQTFTDASSLLSKAVKVDWMNIRS